MKTGYKFEIDAHARKRGDQTGLDTLVVHAVNDDNSLLGSNAQWLSESAIARLKLKGIDGGPHKRRSMWFNSMIREEPYPGSNVWWIIWKHVSRKTLYEVLHGCRQLVPWGVRLSPITSATPTVSCQQVKLGTLAELPTQVERKVGMTSNQHGPYVRGDTRATMVDTEGSYLVTRCKSRKSISVRIGVWNSTPWSWIR